MNIASVLGLGIITAVLSITLRQHKPEYAMMVGVIGSIIIVGYSVAAISPILQEIRGIISESGSMSSNLTIVFKALGIGYLSQFSADACRDAGETGIASKLELAGKVAIVIVILPMIMQLFDLTKQLLT